MFRKKSTWERMAEPVGEVVHQDAVKSGLAAVATAVGVVVASAGVSAVRRKVDAP